MTGGAEHSRGLGVYELVVGAPEPVVPDPEEIVATVEITQDQRDRLLAAAEALEDLAKLEVSVARDEGAVLARVPDPPSTYGCAEEIRAIAAAFDRAEKHPAI